MSKIDALGFIAGILTSLSASPQVYYSFRTKDVKSINLQFLLMLMSGLFLWGVYGIFLWSAPIIVFNFLGFFLWTPIFWLKLKKRRARKPGP